MTSSLPWHVNGWGLQRPPGAPLAERYLGHHGPRDLSLVPLGLVQDHLELRLVPTESVRRFGHPHHEGSDHCPGSRRGSEPERLAPGYSLRVLSRLSTPLHCLLLCERTDQLPSASGLSYLLHTTAVNDHFREGLRLQPPWFRGRSPPLASSPPPVPGPGLPARQRSGPAPRREPGWASGPWRP